MANYRFQSTYQPKPSRNSGRNFSRGPKRDYSWLKPILFWLAKWGIVAGVVGAIVLLAAFAWYGRNLPDPSNLARRTNEASTRIYDKSGEELLYEIHGDRKRTEIPFDEIPQYVKNATLVAEDRNFYTHPGFDIKGILRAVYLNIFTSNSPGGSTVTQQLVKNTIVGGEKTYGRKIREVLLAYRIEQQYDKDEILNMYLNSIPYGSNAYGVEAASGLYFDKSARDLTLAESAIIAALPQSPTFLSPYGNNTDYLFARQKWILNSLAELDYISEQERDAALAEELTFAPFRQDITAPHFVFYIREQLSQKYGENFIETAGLKITTTLDTNFQKIAEEEVLKQALVNEEKYGGKNAALVALDPKTGQILAMVGSRDYFDEEIDGNVNVATRPRQPGSSFKPIVYAAAFEKGFTPNTVLYDVKTTFKTDTKDYTPLNFDLAERGPVNLRTALQGSLNIPAVKLLYLTGIGTVLDFADRLGYSTLSDRSRFGLSLVLGGGEVTLLEHAAAYQAFARDGKYHQPTGILKVEDAKGNLLEQYEENERQAIPAQVAYLITNVLSDNAARAYVFGENSALQLGNRPVAAKTGTTNDSRDAWTMGYTPSLVVGVWAGNNDNSSMTAGGSSAAAPIWNAFMRRALGNVNIEYFRDPDPIEQIGNQALYGVLPNEITVTIDRVSGKLATELTPIDYREQRTYQGLHTILHYIDRNNIKGPPPTNPATDPNYQSWEEALRLWAEKNGSQVGLVPPTEFDDVHTVENKPELNVFNPVDNQTIRGSVVSVNVNATSKRGVKEIGFFLDGKFIGFIEESGTYNIDLSSQSTGFHTLRIDAIDDVGNKTSREIIFNYIP
jgi:1A family penicillin-binding protein